MQGERALEMAKVIRKGQQGRVIDIRKGPK
jgi:hypothetical protein